jgi:hypothetical protein
MLDREPRPLLGKDDVGGDVGDLDAMTVAEVQDARRVVHSRAQDDEDAEFLLTVLGIGADWPKGWRGPVTLV